MSEKNVLLYTDHQFEKEFETVKEAQDYVEDNKFTGTVKIYTLYMKGETSFNWKIQGDTGTNLREAKKQSTKGARAGAWSTLEETTLLDNVKAGMSVSDVAAKLGRSYNATYMKLRTLEEKAKEEGTK